MRNLLTLIVLLISFGVYSQEISPAARAVQRVKPAMYEEIADRAANKYPGDYILQVHEINEEAKAVAVLLILIERREIDAELMLYCMDKHKDDYSLAIYEYKRQLKAKTEL